MRISDWSSDVCSSDLAGVLENYERYEFHSAISRLQIFCSEDLGAFYLDVLKDRLYTTGKDSTARRSAQTALHHVTHARLKLLSSEESRAGKEGGSTWRSRWSP